MKFNFNWKSIVGLVLLALGIGLGIAFDTPFVIVTSIISVVVGATLSIKENVEKTSLKGWQKWAFIGGTVGGTVLFALSGQSEGNILAIAGAILIILCVIFGIAWDKKAE